MPASRRARAMIFAPRSCPSRPGLATTTRIFWVVLGADMATGGPGFYARNDGGARVGPAKTSWMSPTSGDLDRHLHRRRVDLAEDRVGPLRVELLRHDAARAHPRDRLLAAYARA